MSEPCHALCAAVATRAHRLNNRRTRRDMQVADPPPERVTLTVQHLKRVVHGRPVLQDISFAITTGEILFVRGPSGVGKSLLLRCLAHLDPIQARLTPFRPHSLPHALPPWYPRPSEANATTRGSRQPSHIGVSVFRKVGTHPRRCEKQP